MASCLVVAGCGFGPVEVTEYEPEPGTAALCRSLVRQLPETVEDAIRRDLDPALDTAAAWGSPPIVLRCGVPLPAEYRPDAQLYEVDDVAWLPVEGEGGYFFTTVGRVATVEVAVPDDYAPEAAVLTDLAAVLSEHLPITADPDGGATPS